MADPAQGEVCAWHYATGRPVRLRWQAGAITAIERAEPAPPREVWLAPPLFDVQVNGYGGVDFQQEKLSGDDLLSAARQLRAAGCARFFLALITQPWAKLTARLIALREVRSRSKELQSAIVGWHIEGPFLSAEPGFRGAHDAGSMRDPAPELVRELREITREDPVLLTLSPERPGARPPGRGHPPGHRAGGFAGVQSQPGPHRCFGGSAAAGRAGRGDGLHPSRQRLSTPIGSA